jgi:hypothetical protein
MGRSSFDGTETGTFHICDYSEDGQWVAGGHRKSFGREAVTETRMDKVLPILKKLPKNTEVWGSNNIQAQWLHDLRITNVDQLVKAVSKGLSRNRAREYAAKTGMG